MHSPLPDSSFLEAGIVEDTRPSRLSQVQDNVRHLLRSSMVGSIASSPVSSPVLRHQHDIEDIAVPGVDEVREGSLASPATTTATATTSSINDSPRPDPRPSWSSPVTTDHRSTWFNTRPSRALDHPDLEIADPALESLRYHRLSDEDKPDLPNGDAPHARSRRHKYSRSRSRRHRQETNFQAVLCFTAALILASLVATYFALLTTTPSVNTTAFNVLFILGIILTTIILAHTILRLVISAHSRRRSPQNSRRVKTSAHRGTSHRTGHYRRRRRHHHSQRHPHPSNRSAVPLLGTDPTPAFNPTFPIPVHLGPESEILEDTHVVAPSASTLHLNTHPINIRQISPATGAYSKPLDSDGEDDSDIDIEASADPPANAIPRPPPAYGRWRTSVRANPELLHWQAIPLPPPARGAGPDTQMLPSPTYEEAIATDPMGVAFASPPTHPLTPSTSSASTSHHTSPSTSPSHSHPSTRTPSTPPPPSALPKSPTSSTVPYSSPPSYVTRQSPQRSRRRAPTSRSVPSSPAEAHEMPVSSPEMVQIRTLSTRSAEKDEEDE